MGHMLQTVISEVSPRNFEDICMSVFRFQARNNPVYGEYLNHMGIHPEKVSSPGEILFLPVSFFKTHRVACSGGDAGLYFESSGTTGADVSKHYIGDVTIYRDSILRGFRRVYGSPAEFIILGLMPHSQTRKNSSLLFMMDYLINLSDREESGIYPDLSALNDVLKRMSGRRSKFILIGLASLLADFSRKFPVDVGEAGIIMETGGMKGRGEELTREELHQILREAFHKEKIHSEYGMTELLSQAYSTGDGIFTTPPWMKVIIRDTYDPLRPAGKNQPGAVNVIDLANVHTCSFIATEDIGEFDEMGFRILGRMDRSDLRGCNLMTFNLSQ